MNEIWANRLIGGTQTWDNVPASKRTAVKDVLAGRVADGAITPKQYETITGEAYQA